MGKGSIPFWERVGCSVDEAISATSLRRTKMYQLLAAGQINSTRIGGRRVISVKSLHQLIEGHSEPTATV